MTHLQQVRSAQPIPNRLAPLAAAVFGFFGLTAQSAHAAFATIYVSNCDDAGAGSLRDAIANANDGDTVDFSCLSDCTISLSTGQISIPHPNLTIYGNPDVPIDGTNNTAGSALLYHNFGDASLYVEHVTMRNNTKQAAFGAGGCISSKGSVMAYYSNFDHCAVHASLGGALGGAIAANNFVELNHVNISHSEANAAAGYNVAYGGAVFSNGFLDVNYSTISDNAADRPKVALGIAGALLARGGMHVNRSVLHSNFASRGASGLLAAGGPQFILTESTVSGNDSPGGSAVYVADIPDVRVDNATIAFNTAPANTSSSPGLVISTGNGTATDVVVRMHSSIVSNNTAGDYAWDMAIGEIGHTVSFDASSSNNLVRTASGGTLPPDTSTACPLLGPLRDNGGFTWTHALYSGSPAINAGSNPNMDFADQRFSDGIATFFPRESPLGFPDIGAYEVDLNDLVFSDGFETCGP